MSRVIGLSFTLKGRTREDVERELRNFSEDFRSDDTILLHGFMRREDIEAKKFDPWLVNVLDELFPSQIRMYSPELSMAEIRGRMAERLSQESGGLAYVLGPVEHGVADEVDCYRAVGVRVVLC